MFSATDKPWFITPDLEHLNACSDAASLHEFKQLSRQRRHAVILARQNAFYKVLAPHRPGPSDFIVSRIGSPSAFGEVYHVCVDGAHVACKVMPAYSPAFMRKNMQEVSKASLVSKLVILKLCPYFPLMYLAQTDVQVQLDPDSQAARSGRYAACKPLVLKFLTENPSTPLVVKRLLGRPSTRERVLGTEVKSHAELLTLLMTYAGGSERISEEFVQTLIDEAFRATRTFPATLMYSELADGDLGAVLLRSNMSKLPAALQAASVEIRHNVTVFAKLCGQLVEAIEALQEHAGMVHNDLHFANVLVMWRRGQLLPLIHDFGESRVVVMPHFVPAADAALLTTADTSAEGAFTTDQRLYDLQMLFVDKMLSFATDADPELELSSECIALLQRMEAVINGYRAAGRTDANLFAELQRVIAHEVPQVGRRVSQRRADRLRGYVTPALEHTMGMMDVYE